MFDLEYYNMICEFGIWMHKRDDYLKSYGYKRISEEEAKGNINNSNAHSLNANEILKMYRRLIGDEYIYWFLMDTETNRSKKQMSLINSQQYNPNTYLN